MASKQPTLDKKTNTEVSASKSSAAKKNVGQILRKARLEKGYKVTQVVQRLHISEEYIKAIENNDFKKLPTELTYSLGFVRAYAQIVDLDAKEIMDMFKVDFQGLEEAPQDDVVLVDLPSKPKTNLPLMYIALAGGVLILSMGYFASKKGYVPRVLAISDAQISSIQ